MKLLIASEFPPNASGGGPAVVRQMLRKWPSRDLLWWSCLPEQDQRFGQAVHASSCAPIPRKLLPHRRATHFKAAMLERWWAPYATAHLQRTMRRFAPDAVWVIPHNWSILPLGGSLPQAGIGFHVTIQDYPDVHGQAQKFGPARCERMCRLVDRLYVSGTTRDATSYPIISDLRARTGAGAAQMLHAGLEGEDFAYLASKSPVPATALRIAYAGTILASKEFALFVEAIDRLRSSFAMPVSLELFGAHAYSASSWFDSSWMQEHGDLPEPALLRALRECTWGFAPMALTDTDRRYNRFSFPTKFITYLTAGLPVITLGHPESSAMKMAARYALGPALSASDVTELTKQLRQPLADPTPWLRYGQEIQRCAKEEFDAAKKRKKLYECFAQCAEVTRHHLSETTRR